jgi:hypothetical protein
MKRATHVFLLLVAVVGADPLRLSKNYNSLPYRGFSLEKVRNETNGSWGLRLSQPSDDPLEFNLGNSHLPSVPSHIELGIRNLLGGSSRQLVGRIWTGGAHCCVYYWIIDISSSAQVIFDSRRYDGDELQAVESTEDLDGDGIAELTFRNWLRGWRAAAFAHWPAPVQIFMFDMVERQYRPANHEFPTRNTRGLAPILERSALGGRIKTFPGRMMSKPPRTFPSTPDYGSDAQLAPPRSVGSRIGLL